MVGATILPVAVAAFAGTQAVGRAEAADKGLEEAVLGLVEATCGTEFAAVQEAHTGLDFPNVWSEILPRESRQAGDGLSDGAQIKVYAWMLAAADAAGPLHNLRALPKQRTDRSEVGRTVDLLAAATDLADCLQPSQADLVSIMPDTEWDREVRNRAHLPDVAEAARRNLDIAACYSEQSHAIVSAVREQTDVSLLRGRIAQILAARNCDMVGYQ